MNHLILSDLHLGAADARDDFRHWPRAVSSARGAIDPTALPLLDDAFLAFVTAELSRAKEAPHLLLLGDVIDMWQVQNDKESVVDALLRVFLAHPTFFAALRVWLGGGGLLTWVLGNHDQPLVDGKAWAMLAEVLPGLNAQAGGAAQHSYADSAAGLYAEHGHQWDGFNRLRSLHKPDADCFGRRVVRRFVRHLKEASPLLDKGRTTPDLIEQVWKLVEGEGPNILTELAGDLTGLAGCATAPARALLGELHAYISHERTPEFSRVAKEQLRRADANMRRALSPRPGGTIGALPGNLRFLATGHTHDAFTIEVNTARGPITRLNPGTWRPLVEGRKGEEIALSQKLSFARVEQEAGEWAARLGVWEGV